MTKEERIERLEKELAEMKEEIAAEKTGKGPWEPECGSLFYRVSDSGSVGIKRWEDTTCGDEWRWQIGNVFQTEEEAKRMVCRLKARKKFLDAGLPYFPRNPQN